MPNQVNYPDPIPIPYIEYRPDRISEEDRNLIQDGIRQIIFGTTERDHVEIWVYDSNGGIAGHTNLYATDPAISLSTVIDNVPEPTAFERLNVDMGQAVRMMLIESGRYGLTMNFFRDEVGAELNMDGSKGQRLYISDISDDRTELRLLPKTPTQSLLNEIYEWVVPSISKLQSQGLVQETFGQLDNEFVNSSDVLTPPKIMEQLNLLFSNTQARVASANANNAYIDLTTILINTVGQRVLEKLTLVMNDATIQQQELNNLILESTTEVVHELQSSGFIDPRFYVY